MALAAAAVSAAVVFVAAVAAVSLMEPVASVEASTAEAEDTAVNLPCARLRALPVV